MPTFKCTLSMPNNTEKAVQIVAADRDAADAKIRRDYGVTSSGVITCEDGDPDTLDPLDAAQEHDGAGAS